MNPNLLEKTSLVADLQRLTLYGVSWQQYEILRATLDDFAGLRMNYLKGTLEIFRPGAKHEQTKSVIGRLIETYSLETNTRLYACGSTTYKKQAEERGLEPDESYCIGEEKEFPDLAIEVIVTSGSIDLLDIYIGLGVPEVWFWKNGQLSLYRLQAGQYEQIERSILLPNLDINLLVRCANMPDQHDAVIEFRNAIR
jgi:Uma2 family endonuclease